MKTFLAFGAGLALMAVSACTSYNDPLYPSDTTFLRVGVDGGSCYGIGLVDIFIDSRFVGTVQPGDAVTDEVSVGSHGISARAVYIDYQWGPTSIFVPTEGRTHLLYCR